MKILYEVDGFTHILTVPDKKRVEMSNPEVVAMDFPAFLMWVRNISIPKNAMKITVIEADKIPADRTFREALKVDLSYDKDKCVEITKNRLRIERAPKLQALDIEQLNTEDKPTLARIKADKQKLRDVTKNVTSDLTLEQMKALHA